MMMKEKKSQGLFITGTDTGVGKTVVTAALLTLLRGSGLEAVPMKPIQTGCRRARNGLRAPDLEFVLRMAGLQPPAEELSWMCPYRFAPACSPHLAARLARTGIRLARLRTSFRRLGRRHACVLVEGAGGVLAPLGGRRTMLDLMILLGLPVVLVARPGLGTINHTLLSLAALRGAKLRIAGVVLVDTEPRRWGALERENAAAIARLGRVTVLGRLPFMAGLDGALAPAAFRAAITRIARGWPGLSSGWPGIAERD
ncbi:MAG: dethiobiotin synthase [Kiritimatiellaeota bacterium]|nr:dethiobiotin synthase [Kiritimatiellota bacterium]